MLLFYSGQLQRGRHALRRFLGFSVFASIVLQFGLVALGLWRTANSRAPQSVVTYEYVPESVYLSVWQSGLCDAYNIVPKNEQMGFDWMRIPERRNQVITDPMYWALVNSQPKPALIVSGWAAGWPVRCVHFSSSYPNDIGTLLGAWKTGRIDLREIVHFAHILPWRLAANLLLGMIPFFLAALALRLAFMQYRRSRGRCAMCGYPTAQPKNMTTICPECGDGDTAATTTTARAAFVRKLGIW